MHYSFFKNTLLFSLRLLTEKAGIKREQENCLISKLPKRVRTKFYIFLSLYFLEYIYRVKAITRINGVLNEVSSGEVIVTVGTAPASGSFTLRERF